MQYKFRVLFCAFVASIFACTAFLVPQANASSAVQNFNYFGYSKTNIDNNNGGASDTIPWFSGVKFNAINLTNTGNGYARIFNPSPHLYGSMTVTTGQKFKVFISGSASLQVNPSIGSASSIFKFETQALTKYSGSFSCSDDVVETNYEVVYNQNFNSYTFYFAHTLDCYFQAGGTFESMQFGGNLLKLMTTNGSTTNVTFDFDLQGKIALYDDEDTDYLASINNGIGTLNSAINTTNSRLQTLHNDLSGVASAQNSTNNKLDTANNLQTQANQDANDRYDDEKDTINDNASHGAQAFNDAQFSLATPTSVMSQFWSLGTTEQCVDIPMLATMLGGSSNTRYCSWFSTSVRSVVSPIANILIIVIVFGFAVSWLKKGGM